MRRPSIGLGTSTYLVAIALCGATACARTGADVFKKLPPDAHPDALVITPDASEPDAPVDAAPDAPVDASPHDAAVDAK